MTAQPRSAARAIDRQGLHELLWLDAHFKRHTVQIGQAQLAEELRVGQPTLSRTLTAMLAEGRLVRLSQGVRNASYRVTDPAGWNEDGSRREAAAPVEEAR